MNRFYNCIIVTYQWKVHYILPGCNVYSYCSSSFHLSYIEIVLLQAIHSNFVVFSLSSTVRKKVVSLSYILYFTSISPLCTCLALTFTFSLRMLKHLVSISAKLGRMHDGVQASKAKFTWWPTYKVEIRPFTCTVSPISIPGAVQFLVPILSVYKQPDEFETDFVNCLTWLCRLGIHPVGRSQINPVFRWTRVNGV